MRKNGRPRRNPAKFFKTRGLLGRWPYPPGEADVNFGLTCGVRIRPEFAPQLTVGRRRLARLLRVVRARQWNRPGLPGLWFYGPWHRRSSWFGNAGAPFPIPAG